MGSTAFRHLEHLCLEIGPRPVGSKSNFAAAEYIERVFQDCGLDVTLQEFPCPLWEETETHLNLDGKDLTCGDPAASIVTANAFSPPCDVTAPTLALGTVTELEEAELAGHIGLLYGELTKGTGIGARRAVYFPEHHQRIVHLLEQKRPAALITIHAKTGSLERLIRDPEFTIPSATVPAEVGLTLLQHSDALLQLTIDSHATPAQFCNVVAARPGHHPERIALLAHFDTINNVPGAVDNGSGVAILLALGEAFSGRDLRVGLEWIVVNGEENGGLGDAAYLREREDTLDQILALINLDGVGQRVGANTITVMGASQPFQDQVRDLHRRYPGVVWADPWYESDHSAFLWRGVPCVPFTSLGVANIDHLPADNVAWISPTKLSEVASLVTEVIEVLQEKSPGWCREPKTE
jgi:Zn-dependent M28 family amino/carboxypeptidase